MLPTILAAQARSVVGSDQFLSVTVEDEACAGGGVRSGHWSVFHARSIPLPTPFPHLLPTGVGSSPTAVSCIFVDPPHAPHSTACKYVLGQ